MSKHVTKGLPKDSTRDWLLNLAGWLQHDVVCGLHSGFPPCCVIFYITKKRWMAVEENDRYMAKISRREKSLKRRINYVPCPECLRAGRIVRCKPCK